MSSLENNNNYNSNTEYIIIAVLSILFIPIFIITFIMILIMKYKKVRKIYPSVIGIIVISILQIKISIVDTFFYDFVEIIKKIILQDEIHKKVIILFDYSFKSWILILLVSIVLSFAMSYKINNPVNDILPLESEMEKVKNKTKQIRTVKKMDNKSTVIGTYGKKTISTKDNMKHLFVCGTTGSGKTVLLSNYIESAINKGYPLLVIDGKGDLGNGSILDIVKRFAKDRKVYTINMNNPEKSDKYNPFKDTLPTICKDMIINMTEWSEEHYKSNAERYIQHITKLLNKANITLSFKNIIKYIDSDNLTLLSLNLSKEKKIDKTEHIQTLEIIKASFKIAMDAAARFSIVQESEIGNIFDETGIDIYTALKENSIILFILNPLLYPELSKLIGRLIIIDSKKAVSKLFGSNLKRIFFLFDEINVYASPVFIDLINKSRSANVTCISATQSLADLEYNVNDAFKQQIIENCNNYLVMRQNSAKSAEEWANILGTRETLEITHQLGERSNINTSTGYGTAKRVRKYLYHPDDIKSLKTGTAIYMSKDISEHYLIKVRKGF